MTSLPRTSHALTLTRLAFVLAVLAGVILMHSLVVSPHSAAPSVRQHAGHATIVGVEITGATGATGATDPTENCDIRATCSDSWVLHVCAVILAAVITGVAARAIRRIIAILRPGQARGLAPPRFDQPVSRRWVMPLLTELSILRQ